MPGSRKDIRSIRKVPKKEKMDVEQLMHAKKLEIRRAEAEKKKE